MNFDLSALTNFDLSALTHMQIPVMTLLLIGGGLYFGKRLAWGALGMLRKAVVGTFTTFCAAIPGASAKLASGYGVAVLLLVSGLGATGYGYGADQSRLKQPKHPDQEQMLSQMVVKDHIDNDALKNLGAQYAADMSAYQDAVTNTSSVQPVSSATSSMLFWGGIGLALSGCVIGLRTAVNDLVV